MSHSFQEAYESLNNSQKRAVDSIEGPVMVIAGPGTGKTQILALRIANILLKTDTNPENILALTFTDAGAHAMKERLRRYIGDTAYKVAVHTFHSFAGELIRKYPDSYPNIIGGRPATDIEKLSIIEDIINNGSFKELRPNGDPLYYVKKIPSAITDLKKEYITPDNFAQLITKEETALANSPRLHEKGAHKGKVRGDYAKEEKRINKHKELLLVYRLYQTTLRERRLFDFDDMIVETVKALGNKEDTLRDLQETYQYVLADEHQDVNEAQNKVLELLADFHSSPNIFVVGDEKQAIYRFQGASLNNFLYFEDRFKSTTVISLTENYRSTQDILDASHQLVRSDDPDLAKLRVPLKAGRIFKNNGQLEFRNFSHEAVESEWLVSEVKKAIDAKIPPQEIAVILRYNRDVEYFAGLLRRSGIDANASADADILDHPLILAVENMMTAVISYDSEEPLFETLLGSWWGIQSGDLALVLSARSHSRPLYKIIETRDSLEGLSLSNKDAVLRVNEVLEKARALQETTAPHLILQLLLETSGLMDHILKEDPTEGVRVIRRFYDDVEAMVIENQATTLSAVIRQLRYRRTHNLPITAPFIDADQTAVQVMTAHKAKGLEFHTVFMPRATDNAFGNSEQRDYFKLPLYVEKLSKADNEDDEKRLFYVAMTRAKENLLISSSVNTGKGKVCEPSRFVYQLPDNIVKAADTALEEENFKPESILKLGYRPFVLEQKVIRQLFLERGLSVTHLNNYLENPLKYFFENLLRRPQPLSLSLMKGNAVHEVLDRVVVNFTKKQVWPSETELNLMIKSALKKLPFGVYELRAVHEQCLLALSTYLPHLKQNLSKNSRSEFAVRVILKGDSSDLPEIPLTGKIDRVDYDEAGRVIRVYDYKTGKPKSRNEIEGNTQSANANYKRQLVFYAILLELYGAEMSSDVVFVLSFVEPKGKTGEIVEHSFKVEKDEVEKLKLEVIRVAKAIVSGEDF